MEMQAIILTKSVMKKPSTGKSGSCVTAYEPYGNRLVRFVSDEKGSPIPYQISDGFSCLDIVSVDVLYPCPILPQTENLLVEPDSFCVIGAYQPGIEGVYHMVSPPNFPRYMDNYSYKLDSVEEYNHSLELIRVSNLHVFVDSRNKIKTHFQFNSRWKKFYSVTDPEAMRKANAGDLNYANAYVVVSLPTEPDVKSDSYFKFIAAIYPIL